MSGNVPKVDWQPYKSHVSGDLVAKVNVKYLHRPIYSCAIGRKVPDSDRLTLFFSVDKIPDAITILESVYAEFLADEEKQDSENLQRLEAKKQKRTNYVANVERRKEENRARAHPGKK